MFGQTFEAVIVPHRSLSRRGRIILSLALAVIAGTAGVVFLALGAWPVFGFCGLEVGLAILLLHLNGLDGRTSEVILIQDGVAHIARTDRRGRKSELSLPIGWLRIELKERPGRVSGLYLRVGHWKEEVAAALGEEEKRSLATAMTDAVYRARHPVFDNPQLR